MAWWIAILLGVIQGIFMFFPVSSTSHLALMQNWLIARDVELPPADSPEMILFDLIVHVGTLVSIAWVFRQSITQFLRSLWGSLNYWMQGHRGTNETLFLRLGLLGLLSVLVTGLIGFPLKELFESVFAQPMVMSFTLVITGILLYWTDVLPDRQIGLRELGIWVAVVIGIAQGLALLPGLSRSGLTIAFALFAGVKRRWAAEYSFFIAFPTILGATLLQTLEVIQYGGELTIPFSSLLIAFFVSAGVGIVALKLVLALLYRAKFRFFSYYVWTLAAVVFISAIQGWI